MASAAAARTAGVAHAVVAEGAGALGVESAARAIREQLAGAAPAGAQRAVSGRAAAAVEKRERHAAAVAAGLELRAGRTGVGGNARPAGHQRSAGIAPVQGLTGQAERTGLLRAVATVSRSRVAMVG